MARTPPPGGTPPLTPSWSGGKKDLQVHASGSSGSAGGKSSPSTRNSKEEKIKVTVRVRPLSSREVAARETCCWKFPDTHTLQYTEPVGDRSPYPSTYCFDRVFDPACASQIVYMEGARDVVMSSLGGMNATIFAYGQTSSGKTYTMKAVMECAVVDIFEHIQKTPNREYLLRVSAIEIYNEVVKDLLSPEKTPESAKAGLRLLDDPDRGTVVEKLSEVVVRSSAHLMHIIDECEEQRSVGETMLNEASSRSHQIVRLTIESSPRGPAFGSDDNDQVYLSSLNFVDLAGSERASQTLAEGTRLKEGGHINRSLLTLGTVIRKLSSSGSSKNKVGHIPYRDSKLTRILQLSLGGNARTAIICTISPAAYHVDYTRNTLAFATRAREVTNQAHVNVALSDKVKLVQLERQVSRLESELSAAGSSGLLQSKETRISELEEQLQSVKRERDNAQARLQELSQRLDTVGEVKGGGQKLAGWRMIRMRRKSGFSRSSATDQSDDGLQPSSSHRDSDGSSVGAVYHSQPVGPGHRGRRKNRKSLSQTSLALISEIRNLEHMQDELGEDANKAMEALLKEIECMRIAQAGMNHHAADTIQKLQQEIRNIQELQGRTHQGSGESSAPVTVESLEEELRRLKNSEESTDKLEAQLESVQQSLDQMCEETESRGKHKEEEWPAPSHTRKSSLGGEELLSSETFGDIRRDTPSGATPDEVDSGPRMRGSQHRRSSSLDLRKMQNLFKTAAEDNIKAIRNYVTDLKERVAKLHFQKQLLVCQVLELEASQKRRETAEELDTSTENQTQGKLAEIYELWDACQVSLIHRTQFHLLMTGEPGDGIYTEVEHRRLVWLKDRCEDAGNAKEQAAMAQRVKQLQRERAQLARRMKTRLSEEERNQLFESWGVPADTKKRKLQLAHKLWEDPKDMDSNAASAELVAHIMGFPTDASAKEMFQLSLGTPKLEKPLLVRLFSLRS